jgi:hypothetical protein
MWKSAPSGPATSSAKNLPIEVPVIRRTACPRTRTGASARDMAWHGKGGGWLPVLGDLVRARACAARIGVGSARKFWAPGRAPNDQNFRDQNNA